MLNRWAHKHTASPGLAWPEVLQGTLISSRCSNDTEGRLTHAGREIKEGKTGIRAIRVHQKHRPALQQQRSATDENMELPLTYPFRQSRCFFFQAADLQRDALGARDKEQDGSKHTVMIHCSILTTLVHPGPQGDGSGYRDPQDVQPFVPNSS